MTTPRGVGRGPDSALAGGCNGENLAALGELAEEAARLGGQTLLEWRERFAAREKGPSDLVTDADIASQEAIRSLLLKERSSDLFIGEEGEASEEDRSEDQICWVVDPIDGTVNYVHGFPFFCSSVAAVCGDRILAGAVYDPLRDELFRAEAGCGARLNGQAIWSSAATRFIDSLVAVSLPPRVDPDSPDLRSFVRAITQCRAVRRSGSAALNLAYVACGRLDAHWAHAIHPWDVAAGVLLVTEAGGAISSSTGGPFDVWRADYLVASTETLRTEAIQVLVGED